MAGWSRQLALDRTVVTSRSFARGARRKLGRTIETLEFKPEIVAPPSSTDPKRPFMLWLEAEEIGIEWYCLEQLYDRRCFAALQ